MRHCSSPTAFRNLCVRPVESGEEAHCAVLYRTNSQSRLVEEALRRYGVKYSMVGGFSFYERAEIKDLLSYLRLVQQSARLHGAESRDQHACRAASAKPRLKRWSGSRLRPDNPPGTRWGRRSSSG